MVRIGISLALGILLISPGTECMANANGGEQQICDVRADYALGIENYSEAVTLHSELLRSRPDNALARYHLGFAEGMLGDRTAELEEFKRAAALGLRLWDLFLNIGLAQFENGELYAATNSLQRAVVLGPDHSESHYNLALVYERRGLLADAEREMAVSLSLNPEEADARNMLGVIYTEEGKTVRASHVWHELTLELFDYEPARKNLALLGIQRELALRKTAAVTLLPERPPSTRSENEPRATLPASEIPERPPQSIGE